MSKRVHFVVSRAPNLPKSNKGERRGERKKNGSKKRPWDATVSDLSVHKLSRDELERRRKTHQSKNADIAKHDLYEKAKENFDLDSSGNLRPSPLTTRGGGQKFAALQRSLQGKELHEVLAESDRALRVVKDMFGDDPMRYTCQPNVTVAPHIVSDKANLERTLMESQRDGPSPTAFASPGGIRDESILELAPSKPALNELPTPTELTFEESGPTEDPTLTPSSPDPSTTPQERGYKSSLDLKRFQALIQREEHVDPNSTDPVNPKPYRRPLSDWTQKAEKNSNSSKMMQQTTDKGTSKQKSGLVNETQTSTQRPASDRPTLHVHVPSAGSTHAQMTAEHDDSVTGLSDISSIPAHTEGGGEGLDTDGGGNVTVDSDNSLIYSKDAVPLTRPVLSAHPLHVAHKMTPVKRQETTDKIHSELQQLEKLVRGLDRELQDYEQTTSYTSPSLAPPTLTFDPDGGPATRSQAHSVRMQSPTSGTLSGITSSLLSSVTKMTHYLRESEAQLKGEMEVRGHLLQTMTEQQNLMDALTSDVVKLQKDNLLLRKEIQEAKHNTSEQLLTMQREISDLHKKLSTLVIHPPPQPTPVWSSQPLHHGPIPAVSSLHNLQTQGQTKEVPSSRRSFEKSPEQLQQLNSHPQHYATISPSLNLPYSSSSRGSSTHIQSDTLKGLSVGGISPGSVSGHNRTSRVNPEVTSTRSPVNSHVAVCAPDSSSSQSGVTYIYAQQSPLSYSHGASTVTPHTASRDTHSAKLSYSTEISTTMPVPTDNPSAQLTSGVNTVNMPLSKEHSVEPTPPYVYVQDLQFSLPSQSQAFGTNTTTSSTTIPTSFNDTFAPAPPPLSIALQVPVVNGLMSETSTQTTINKMKSKHSTATCLSSGTVFNSSGVSSERKGSTEPVFDVTSFLNSLGKLHTRESRDKTKVFHSSSEITSTPQPSLSIPSQTETVITQMSTFPTPNSTNVTAATSEKPALDGKFTNGTPAPTTSRGKLSNTVAEHALSSRLLQTPDLSISLLSSLPDQTVSPQTGSETSLDSRLEHPHAYETTFRNDTLKQSSSGTKLAHEESVVDSKLPPGWFALTSHLSHQ